MARTRRRGKVARKSRVQTHRNNAMKPRVQTRRNNAVKKSVTRKRPRRSRGKMKGGEGPEIDVVEEVTPVACPVSGKFTTGLKIDALKQFLTNEDPQYKKHIELFLKELPPNLRTTHGAEINRLETVIKQLNHGPIKLGDEAITIYNVHDWAQNNFYINRYDEDSTPVFFGKKLSALEKNKYEYEIIFPSHRDFQEKPRGLNFKIKPDNKIFNKVYKISCS